MRLLLDKSRVYLDYNSTTPPAAFLSHKIIEWLSLWGNPSSVHQDGQKARALFWASKVHLAQFLSCDPLELIITSGGSEANNMAIKGLYEKYFPQNPQKKEILLSAVEHQSVIAPMRALQQKGMVLKYIPISPEGELDFSFYKSALSERTFMVSVMFANNETGHIFPIAKLARLAQKAGAFFHCDAVQALGKTRLDLSTLGVDMASFSAHKFYGLKGTGALYCRKGLLPVSLIEGGPQERKRRAGTENVLGLACFGAVAKRGAEILNQTGFEQGATLEVCPSYKVDKKLENSSKTSIRTLRDNMEQSIVSALPQAKVLGPKGKRLNNTSCICVPGVDGETLLMNMDLKGYSFSVGSACHSGSLRPSSVLMAMGLSEKTARSSFRISLGLGTCQEDIDRFVPDLISSIKRVQSL